MTTTIEAREDLRRSLRDFLDDRMPMTTVRSQVDSDDRFDRKLWESLATDIGIQGLAVAESDGGGGAGWAETAVAFEETGRLLAPLPLLATVGLALPVLQRYDDESARTLVRRIATGSVAVTLAWDDGVDARHESGGWRLTGRYPQVLDGDIVDVVVAIAHTDDGPGIFVVDVDDVVRTPQQTLDVTRGLATIELDSAPATLLGAAGSGSAAVASALDHARILLAAEMLGGAQACLDMAVRYAATREQFGRPIGSFQAIKHKCAELLVLVESTRSGVEAAARALDDDTQRAGLLAPLVKAYGADAFFRAAGENLQIHGGIGFTWEHDAHLYLKRAKSSDLLLGDSATHRALLADRLGL